MILEIRNDITCNFCQAPVTDLRRAFFLWRRRSRGQPLILVAHADSCVTPQVSKYYSSSTYLSEIAERQEHMRQYFNAEIFENHFTRREVTDGLEQIFRTVPDEFFHFTEADYVAFMEGANTDDSERTLDSDIGRCPKCGIQGRNHEPPEADPDEGVLIVPFECLNCGHEWTERVDDDSL